MIFLNFAGIMSTIAVNTRILKDRLEGVGHFSNEALKRITLQHPEHRFVFLFDRPYNPVFIYADNIEPLVVSPPARHPFLWYVWFEYAVPKVLKKIKPDLFLSPDGYCSLKTDIKTHLTIHDLAFEHYPEYVPFLVRKYYQYYIQRFARKCHRLTTVSDFTRQDIHQKYQVPLSKIDVVYNGADAFELLNIEEKEATKQQYAKGCDYFVFVGAIHPRKNLGNILKAYDAFKKTADTDIKLVIAGRKAWQSKAAFDAYNNMQYKDEVLFLGHLPIDELTKIVGAAFALVYPSFFEGFGIPIVEAMRCEIPVITANVSSMPEVAGDAALLVPPDSAEAIKEAMLRLYHEPDLCRQLIEKGKQQQLLFSWDKTAERYWKSIEQCLA